MKLDRALSDLLGIDAERSRIVSAGGSGCSSATTYKIVALLEAGSEKIYFLKTGSGKSAEIMFKGLSLN